MGKPFKKVDRTLFKQTNLIQIEGLSTSEIDILLDLGDYYADRISNRSFKSKILDNAVILTLFFEDSTRTRTSFEMAAKRLGADVVNIQLETSSVNKGESLLDTVMTLDAMLHPDAIIIRHKEYGAPDLVAQHIECPVINAGDSWRAHPTQALLDALTLRRHFGTLKDLKVAICGDIAHSRVANSNIHLLHNTGAQIHVIAPPALMPTKLPFSSIKQFHSLEEGIEDCDVIMGLRLQKERMEESLIPSKEQYFQEFGITHEKLKCAKDNVVVMHPGPINRGVEISDAVADDQKKNLILEQVHNGVPMRMAILDLLLKNKLSAE